MQSQSNSTNSPQNNESQKLDLSPKSQSKISQEAVWFNINISKFQGIYNGVNISKKSRLGETPSKRWGHSSLIYNKSMLVFGGRHSHRSLVNIYSLDFSTFTWSKMEPLGQSPPARDSHSSILFKNELIAFGGSGSGKKLNDLWIFNLETKKWSKLNAQGEYPIPREGHSCALIRNTFMMVYGGLDENDRNISDIYLLDLINHKWHKVNSTGVEPLLRDSQSCTQIYNTCYIFGGQGESDKLFNDMYTLSFEIAENEQKFTAIWSSEEVTGKKPPARTSHSATSYKNQYLIIIGGEGYDLNGNDRIPLNDAWIYNTVNKTWSEINVKNPEIFEGRMCHSACLNGERIYVYGGMKNADTTLENISILCIDGKTDDLETVLNCTNNAAEELNKNFEKVKNYLSNEYNTNANYNPGGEKNFSEEYLLVCNNINAVPMPNSNSKLTSSKDEGVDTSDLIEDGSFDFENLKRNYLNNMISWSFLKKLSDFNQWPLGCIGNFVENSISEDVNSKNIFIDVKCYDKKVYSHISSGSNHTEPTSNLLKDSSDFKEKILVLSVKDDGRGINTKDFNQILYSFSTNENKEYCFFKYGVSMKTSAVRLANSFLMVTKTEDEASIGLISKSLQVKLETDFILTPIVNYIIDKGDSGGTNIGKTRYIARSNFYQQSLHLILNEIKFLFNDSDDFFNYLNSFETGTHLFLYNLRQISSNKKDLNNLSNYELVFDYENNDILFNYFKIQVGENNFIDCSLNTYIRFLYLKPRHTNIFIFDHKIKFKNPLNSIYNLSKNIPDSIHINTNLKCNVESSNSFYIEGDIYNGIVYNHNYFKALSEIYNFENCEDLESFNGVLVYRNNRLVCRFGQSKLGDISYFIKKYQKMNSIKFPISGFIEVPSSFFELLHNKMEFKDQAIYALFYSKLKRIMNKIKTTNEL